MDSCVCILHIHPERKRDRDRKNVPRVQVNATKGTYTSPAFTVLVNSLKAGLARQVYKMGISLNGARFLINVIIIITVIINFINIKELIVNIISHVQSHELLYSISKPTFVMHPHRILQNNEIPQMNPALVLFHILFS